MQKAVDDRLELLSCSFPYETANRHNYFEHNRNTANYFAITIQLKLPPIERVQYSWNENKNCVN